MKIKIIDKKTINQNDDTLHNYSGWPTVARLGDGRLALAVSSFRLFHTCPFGKSALMYSSDEGATWSLPTPVFDTILDDRDAGIGVFGEKEFLITSFNMTLDFSRQFLQDLEWYACPEAMEYTRNYLDMTEKLFPDWKKYHTSSFRITHDGGVTFGERISIPISAPHGPTPFGDGDLLYVGWEFDLCERQSTHIPKDRGYIHAYRVKKDGSYEKLGTIDLIDDDISGALDVTVMSEATSVVTNSGKIVVHMRVQDLKAEKVFTIYQSESYDGGHTFTKPHRLLERKGGAPAHLYKTPDGVLISTYGYREYPFGIRVMFSFDEGETWDTANVIDTNEIGGGDNGYPSSVMLRDGSILTVWYRRRGVNESAVIEQVVWRYEND